MRFDQSVRAAGSLLEQGAMGEPVFATIDMRGIPHWMDWHKELGRLTLRIMSIHHLDTFRYWFGDPASIYCSVRTDPRTQFPHTDGICTYILEYANGLRCVGIDDTWTGPAKEGCPADIRIAWRIEGTKGIAVGDIGWCKDPYTTPSTIRYAAIGDRDWHRPVWTESWFPDAFVGTMAQLLIALETGREPAISGRDNLKTIGLVEAAYLSAAQFRSVGLDVIERLGGAPESTPPRKPSGFFEWLFSAPNILTASSVSRSSPVDETESNFTPRAQRTLVLARQEAERLNHSFVGTEHLLLGLIELGQGVAVNVLEKMGLDLYTIRAEIEKQIAKGPFPSTSGNIPFTPRVKKVLALAAKECKALSHTYVGTEHILLGLLCVADSVAARVLTNLGLELEPTRSEILKKVDPNSTDRGG